MCFKKTHHTAEEDIYRENQFNQFSSAGFLAKVSSIGMGVEWVLNTIDLCISRRTDVFRLCGQEKIAVHCET